jgi:hypothetical protein
MNDSTASAQSSPRLSRYEPRKFGEYSKEEIANSLQNLIIKDSPASSRRELSSTSSIQSLEKLIPSTPKKLLRLLDLQILQTLGTGSFGRVHLVKLKENEKYYALKVLKKADVVKLKQVEHTLNEKKILDGLCHPFLVSMVSSFQDSMNLYFVLEYIQGGELFTYLRKCTVRIVNQEIP